MIPRKIFLFILILFYSCTTLCAQEIAENDSSYKKRPTHAYIGKHIVGAHFSYGISNLSGNFLSKDDIGFEIMEDNVTSRRNAFNLGLYYKTPISYYDGTDKPHTFFVFEGVYSKRAYNLNLSFNDTTYFPDNSPRFLLENRIDGHNALHYLDLNSYVGVYLHKNFSVQTGIGTGLRIASSGNFTSSRIATPFTDFDQPSIISAEIDLNSLPAIDFFDMYVCLAAEYHTKNFNIAVSGMWDFVGFDVGTDTFINNDHAFKTFLISLRIPILKGEYWGDW